MLRLVLFETLVLVLFVVTELLLLLVELVSTKLVLPYPPVSDEFWLIKVGAVVVLGAPVTVVVFVVTPSVVLVDPVVVCAKAAPAIEKASNPAVIILIIIVHLRVSAQFGHYVLIATG